jgi:hypothetical protein
VSLIVAASGISPVWVSWSATVIQGVGGTAGREITPRARLASESATHAATSRTRRAERRATVDHGKGPIGVTST